MARKKKAPWQQFLVSYRYADGSVESVGRITGRPGEWTIRYTSISQQGGQELCEAVHRDDIKETTVELFTRWWAVQRKLDANRLLSSIEELKSWKDPESRRFLPYAIFDAIKNSEPSNGHDSLDNAIAKWEWWETVGVEFRPPLGFSCLCKLFAMSGSRARRMLEAGEVYDLERVGLPRLAVDPEWKAWSEEFLAVYSSLRATGLSQADAQETALLAAGSLIRNKDSVGDRLIAEEIQS